ncbi:MAG: succinylglutamate desuccinylase/aspartoacylase family protein [archaeon]
MKVGIVSCVHGNETLGKEVVDRMVSFNQGNLFFIFANKKAFTQQKRFVDKDLNRCFPGKKFGCHEEMLAYDLMFKLKQDFVIDIHSTTAKTESFVIITKINDKVKKLVRCIPLEKVVFMEPQIANGKALIDHVNCGVAIEFGSDVDAFDVVLTTLKNLGVVNGKKKFVEQKFYSVYGVLNGNKKFTNFKLSEDKGKLFYPVLHGEKHYGFTCMKAKKIE